MDTSSPLVDTIHALEVRLLQPAVRSSTAALDDLLAEDFIEIGSSGQMYSKQQVIEALQHETGVEHSLLDFHVRQLAIHVVLATYRTTRITRGNEGPAYALRSSIWTFVDGQWRMAFHQGTPTTGIS